MIVIICILLSIVFVFLFQSRRAECAMVGKKPAIAITQDFSLFIGNTSDAELALDAGELFGFRRGTFDQKEIRHSTNFSKLLLRLSQDAFNVFDSKFQFYVL